MHKKQHIINKLKEAFKPKYLSVMDESDKHSRGLETHFHIIIVSEIFENLNPVERRRKIFEVLKQESEEIHSLTFQPFTPQQWVDRKGEFLKTPTCMGGEKNSKK